MWHVHTHTHTHPNTRTHTHMYTHTHTHANKHTHTHTHTQWVTYAHTHMHTHTQTNSETTTCAEIRRSPSLTVLSLSLSRPSHSYSRVNSAKCSTVLQHNLRSKAGQPESWPQSFVSYAYHEHVSKVKQSLISYIIHHTASSLTSLRKKNQSAPTDNLDCHAKEDSSQLTTRLRLEFEIRREMVADIAEIAMFMAFASTGTGSPNRLKYSRKTRISEAQSKQWSRPSPFTRCSK